MKYMNYHKKGEVRAAVANVTARISLRIWVVLLVLFISNIYVAVSSATYGAKLIAIEKEIQSVSEESKVLREEMVAHQSLQNISLKANEMGLVDPSEVVYLDAPPSLTAAY